MAHHLLRDQNLLVRLAIVHRKLQADEVGQDRRRASLRLDRGGTGGRGELFWERETVFYRSMYKLADGRQSVSEGTIWMRRGI